MTDYQGKKAQTQFDKDVDEYLDNVSNCKHEITTKQIDRATKQTFCSNCNYVFGHSIDNSIKVEECNQNGHKWQISGLYKHNPHLWCSNCGWYLETQRIKKEGLTRIFITLLNTDNPEGYYLSLGSYEWLMENGDLLK